MLGETLSNEIYLVHGSADHLIDPGDITVCLILGRLSEPDGQNWLAQLCLTHLRGSE